MLTSVATPAAHECVKFLIQHKQWLGIKTISHIRVWRGPPQTIPDKGPIRFPQFIFDIEDVPADQVKADPPPGWKPPDKKNRPGIPNFIPEFIPDSSLPGAPRPSNPQPGVSAPSVPQPVVPGPSTPRPGPPPRARARREEVIDFSHKISVQKHNQNFMRVHTFQKA
jgi:hypothetical protein